MKRLLVIFGCLTAAAAAATENPPDETIREPHVQTAPFSNAQWIDPNPTESQAEQILARYAYVDKDHAIPDDLLRTAIIYYDYNKLLLSNTAFLTVVDFGAYSGKARFHIIDMHSGAVTSTYVAHGKGSDPNFTGYATKFSNTVNSEETALGMYLAGETYSGSHPGLSMHLDGLSKTNSNARDRDIVVHGATYVYDQPVKQGRSLGCLALPMDEHDAIINKLKGGSLIYAGVPAAPAASAAFPALWEAANPAGKQWTAYAYDAVATYGTSLLNGTSDMSEFCGKYSSLNANQKTTFWVYLASAVAKYESDFNPDDRYLETQLGKDPITGLPVYSEGLLQLSYQDVLTYPYCNQFDWNTDKLLKPTDPNKTIFDAKKNLTCGLRILNQQVGSKKKIAVAGYWSTLNPGSTHGKVASIQGLTKKIPFCW